MLQAFDEGRLFAHTYATPPYRVLWLHGWGRSGTDFDAAASALERDGVASLALDLPGFGSSPLPAVAGGARHYADLLEPLLREITTDGPVVIVGHSFGGRVGAVLASRHHQLVRALVLTGAPLLARGGRRSRSPVGYRVIRFLAARHLVSAERLERARQRYGSADYRAAQGLLREILVATVGESYAQELAALQQPTRLVWGALDTDVPTSVARAALELVPGQCELREVADAGHLLPLTHPDALVDATRDLL